MRMALCLYLYGRTAVLKAFGIGWALLRRLLSYGLQKEVSAMIGKVSYVCPTGNGFGARLRSLLLVVPVLLAAYTVAGPLSPTFASSPDGTVTVTADTAVAAPGAFVVYTVTLQNGSQAGIVTLNDNLPPHTTLVDAPGCDTHNG